jgi:DNA-binding GntR family transcriptional regulator
MSTANNYMSLINSFQRKVTADLIAEYLRDRILDGSLAPSTSINETHLASQLEIGRSPVREAVQRLVQEGLLVSTRNRGTSVVELAPEDMEDVYMARRAIEREAARLVLRDDTTGLTAQLDAVIGDMSQALEQDKWHDVATADVKFHQTIVQAAGSPRLERMFSTPAAETLLCVRQFQYVFERKESILAQHRRLRDLIEAGDEEAYLAEIDRHLNGAIPHPVAKGPKAPQAAVLPKNLGWAFL